MKNTFAFVIDVLFVGFISFVLALVIFNFFIPRPYSVIYSACFSLLITTLYFARADKKRKSLTLSREDEKAKRALISELNFSTRLEQFAILERGLEGAGLIFERKRGAILIKDKNALVFLAFSFSPAGRAEVVKAFNALTKSQTAYILAQSFTADLTAFAERFDGRVILVGQDEVYSFLKEQGALPSSYKYEKFIEKQKKGSLKNLLDKRKAKTFFIFGTLFLLFSYISPLKVYYIVCGCLFLIYALVLRLFGKELKKFARGTDKN